MTQRALQDHRRHNLPQMDLVHSGREHCTGLGAAGRFFGGGVTVRLRTQPLGWGPTITRGDRMSEAGATVPGTYFVNGGPKNRGRPGGLLAG